MQEGLVSQSNQGGAIMIGVEQLLSLGFLQRFFTVRQSSNAHRRRFAVHRLHDCFRPRKLLAALVADVHNLAGRNVESLADSVLNVKLGSAVVSPSRNIQASCSCLRYSIRLALPMLLCLLASTAVAQSHTERRVIFMIDRSGSMGSSKNEDGSQRNFSLAEESQNAIAQANTILEQLEQYPDVRVSFFVFGEKSGLAPFDEHALELPPRAAIGRLERFFSADPTDYRQERTYIAYSIFEMVRASLGLGADFGTDDDIPESASLFYIFVFTDGGEYHDKGWDNRPYEAWLARQARRAQVRWQVWTLYATGEQREQRDSAFAPEAPDRVTYVVNFGEATNAFSLDPLRAPADRTVSVEVPRLIRLIPEVVAGTALPSDALICEGESELPPRATSAGELLVQAQVDWGRTDLSLATADWRISAPERRVIDRSLPTTAVPRLELERAVLRLGLGNDTRIVIPTFELPAGSYPIRYHQASLCQELARVYGNSRFVFPADPSNTLPAIARVIVEHVPDYVLALSSSDGVSPDSPMTALTASRWHQYTRATRRFRMLAPEGVRGYVDFQLTVMGPSMSSARSFSAFVGEQSDSTMRVALGEEVELAAPSAPSDWLRSALGLDAMPEPGSYTVRVCGRPHIDSAPHQSYRLRLSCPDCAETHGEEHELCVDSSIEVVEPPLSWWWIGFLGLLGLVIARVALRWHTRPRFPPGLTIGNLASARDLRTAHGRGLTGVWSLYSRKPGYVALGSNGRCSFMRAPNIPRDPNKANALTVIGLRPSPSGARSFQLWCVAVSDSQEDAETGRLRSYLSIDGVELQPQREVPRPGSKAVAQFSYAELRAKEETLKLMCEHHGQLPIVLETYSVRFLEA
jgi:hypothetical protein